MPYFGLLPFLRKKCSELHMVQNIVSMPYFGLLPFLQMFRITYGSEYMVSMPYFGLLPFLLCNLVIYKRFFEKVSMPYFGLLPFLRKKDTMELQINFFVSMPYFGLLPFLLIMTNTTLSINFYCFNALLRASSFSTKGGQKIRCQYYHVFQCPTSGFFLFYNKIIIRRRYLL